MTTPDMLVAAERAYLIAPAGCGKTHIIAQAVCLDSTRKSLILTHTHAGVDALRRRLATMGATHSSYRVVTIAGFCLRLTKSFPTSTGISSSLPERNEWEMVYLASEELLTRGAIKDVIRASYQSLYVDEYQDCTPAQHQVVLKLSELLPTRLLGDPLQGIFRFKNSAIVDWDKDIKPNFDPLPQLDTPYRWRNHNAMLGNWLQDVRADIEKGEPFDLRKAPTGVKYIRTEKDNGLRRLQIHQSCMNAKTNCPAGQSLLIIQQMEVQCQNLVRTLGGLYSSPEIIECPDLFRFAKQFDEAVDNMHKAQIIYEFARCCITKIGSMTTTAERLFEGKELRQNHIYKNVHVQLVSLQRIVSSGSLNDVLAALLLFPKVPDARIVRDELFYEMVRALKALENSGYASLTEAATAIRNQTRVQGRRMRQHVVSRTLLVKGLEFDHVAIVNPSELNKENLYVAMTRGSRTLSIFSPTPIIQIKS